MTTGIANSKTTDEAQIRELIADREIAVRARDVNGSMTNIAPNVVSFDVVNPLRHTGADSIRQRAEEWFGSFQGPVDFETRELTIAAGDAVAFSYGLSHVSATKSDGTVLDMWWRTTLCFSKTDSKWMIAHEHNSVPFDVENGKAS